MHSADDLRDAARFAGCKLIELRQVKTQAGLIWYSKVDCGDSSHKFKYLRRLASLDDGDPEVRDAALALYKEARRDPEVTARKIQEFVKSRVCFVREPKETFQSAAYTLTVGAGDCDDHATLVYALARNCGLEASIEPLWKTDPKTGARWIGHAVTRVKVNGAPRWLETTVDALYDEHPQDAARRLRLGHRRDIL